MNVMVVGLTRPANLDLDLNRALENDHLPIETPLPLPQAFRNQCEKKIEPDNTQIGPSNALLVLILFKKVGDIFEKFSGVGAPLSVVSDLSALVLRTTE